MSALVEGIIHRLRYAHVEPHLAPCRSWADLGCRSDHHFLRRHRALAQRAWGLDVTVEPGRDGAIELLRHDITKPLPFADGSLDLVTCLAVLEHIDAPREVLKEVRRCLAPGGRLVATTPSRLGIRLHAWMLAHGLVADVEPDEHRDFGMSPALLAGWAEEAGLEVERAKTFELGINVLLVARRPG